MAHPLDLVTLQEAAEYLDVRPDGAEITRQLERFITGASLAIDKQRGPIIARELAGVVAGSTMPRVEVTATGKQLSELAWWRGSCVSIGTAADPWASVPLARLERVDFSARQVVLSGERLDIASGSSIYVGRHLLADLPGEVKLAALVTIRNRWQFEVAAVSQTYDNPQGGTPYVIPHAALDLLADYAPSGIA